MGYIYLKNFECHQGIKHITREVKLPAVLIDKSSAWFIQFQEQLDYGKVDNLLKIDKQGQHSYLKRKGAMTVTLKFDTVQHYSDQLSHIYGTMKYDLQTLQHIVSYDNHKIIYEVMYHFKLSGEDMGQQGIYIEYIQEEGDNNDRY